MDSDKQVWEVIGNLVGDKHNVDYVALNDRYLVEVTCEDF